MPVAKTKNAVILLLVGMNWLYGNKTLAQTLPDSNLSAEHFKNQFLWFKGHWNPNNKKQFVIDKDTSTIGGVGSPGGTIIIEPDRSVKLSTGAIEQWNKKIDESIHIAEDWESKLEHPTSPDLASYDLNQILLPEVKADKTQYSNYKISSSTDILSPGTEEKAMNRLGGNVAAGCEKFKAQYDEIMAFWKAHKNDKDADLSIPKPPEFEYNCYACVSNIRKDYDTTIEHYVRDFFHPEDNYVREGLGIIRDFALMGIGPAGQGVSSEFNPILDLFHTDKKDPSKSGACAYLDLYQLNNAIRDICYHGYRRSAELVIRFRKDFKASEAIVKTALAGLRTWILFSGNDYAAKDLMSDLSDLVRKIIDFYLDKLKQHDWKQLANIPFIFSLIRQKAMLIGSTDDGDYKTLCEQISGILNNFHLSIDMDIKIGKEGGYELCHLKGETKIAPDFTQQQNQCYRWVAVEDEPKEFIKGLKEPVKKKLQSIDVNLLANQIIASSPLVPVYAGTHKYYTVLKNLRMDFCNPGQDSIMLSNFIPTPLVTSGLWNIPHSRPAPLGINGLDHFFQDEEKMKEEVQSGEAQEGAAEMKKQGEEMKEKMKTLASQMGNGKGKNDLDKYMQLMKTATQAQDIGNSNKVNALLSIVFPLSVANNNNLVDKKYDAKELNPSEASVIVYGYYTILIQYKTAQ